MNNNWDVKCLHIRCHIPDNDIVGAVIKTIVLDSKILRSNLAFVHLKELVCLLCLPNQIAVPGTV